MPAEAVGRVSRTERSRTLRLHNVTWLLAAVSVLLCVGSLRPQTASAYHYLDEPGEDCSLHSITPGTVGASYHPQAYIDCIIVSNAWMQVCANVFNRPSGNWYFVSNSCAPSDTTFYYWANLFGTTSTEGKWEKGTCGHYYRTADQGQDNWSNPPTVVADYSGGETQC